MEDFTPPVIRFFSGKAKNLDKSYEIFSNFASVPVIINNLFYSTTEHYFQSMKFIDTDPEYAETIRLSSTPLEAKKLGKNRKHPMIENWNDIRVDVMYTALFSKMLQSSLFREALLRSKGSKIVEASPFDAYWGEGRNKKGKNMLGNLLMVIRKKYLIHLDTIYT